MAVSQRLVFIGSIMGNERSDWSITGIPCDTSILKSFIVYSTYFF